MRATASFLRTRTPIDRSGEQFDVVVLPELDFKLLGQAPRVVIGRDGPAGPVELICRGVNKELLPLLPKAVGSAYNTQRRRMVEETLCLLYVALTRAVHALHVIIAPSKNQKEKLHAKPSHLLRAALTDGKPLDPEQVFHESGNPNWWAPSATGVVDSGAAGVSPVPPVPPTPSTGLPRIALAPSSGHAPRGLQRLTPSGLEGGRHVRLSGVLRLDNQPALQRGTIVHAWFELIGWLDEDGIPGDDVLRETAVRVADGTLDVDVDQLLEEFRAMLARPAIAALLNREERHDQIAAAGRPRTVPELHREWPFVLSEDDGILRGSVDRLVVFRDGPRAVAADIVDFKTDRVTEDDPDTLRERVDHYRPQMAAYRRAVARHFGIPAEQVTTRLAFTEVGLTVDVGVQSI